MSDYAGNEQALKVSITSLKVLSDTMLGAYYIFACTQLFLPHAVQNRQCIS